MICPKCGNQNMEGSTICVKCGTNLKDLNQNNITNNGFVDSNIQNNFESTNNFVNPSVQEPINNYTEPVQEPVNSTNDFINPGSQPVQQDYTESQVIPPFVNPGVQEPVNNYTEPVQELVNSTNDFINPGSQPVQQEYTESQVIPPFVNPSVQEPINNYTEPVQEPVNYSNPTVEQPVYNNYSNVNNYNNETKKSNKLIPIIVIVLLIALGFGAYKLFFSKEKSNSESFNEVALIPVKQDGNYIYIDLNGNNAFGDKKFRSATSFYDGYAMVESDYKKSIINEKGEVVLEENGSGIHDGYISKLKLWIINGKLYSSNLKKLSSDDISVEYYDTVLKYKSLDSKTVGLINEKGKIVYTYKLEETDDDYLSVSVDKDINKEIVGNRYCSIRISEDYKSERDYDKYGLINCDTGKVVIPLSEENEYIYPSDNNIFTLVDGGVRYKIIVANDKIVFKGKEDEYSIYDRIPYYEIYEKENYTRQYYDLTSGKIIDEKPETPKVDVDLENVPTEFEERYKVTLTKENYKYGLKKGDKEILKNEYDSIFGFKTPIYDYLKSKGKEYIFAEKDNKTYLLDMKGKQIKEFNSTYITTESDSPFIKYTDKEINKTIVYNVLNGKSLEIDYNYSYSYMYETYFVTRENGGNGFYKWIYKYYNGDCKLIYTEEA